MDRCDICWNNIGVQKDACRLRRYTTGARVFCNCPGYRGEKGADLEESEREMHPAAFAMTHFECKSVPIRAGCNDTQVHSSKCSCASIQINKCALAREQSRPQVSQTY